MRPLLVFRVLGLGRRCHLFCSEPEGARTTRSQPEPRSEPEGHGPGQPGWQPKTLKTPGTALAKDAVGDVEQRHRGPAGLDSQPVPSRTQRRHRAARPGRSGP